ncbi:CxxxxCH/CxxCH domain-containing protein [Anaeromyxobacter sp. SG66]|uniref:CxxxxCH/CxxCH domain c-type cytochrome n=1 Tax=Anaeromyxobacter sp. SG66 TaxID=2925410 RepID=UPI001F590194|nr:CxxxxCH/CxxCH domain-containing protein [Anaeromyxobacter sp. SG66]
MQSGLGSLAPPRLPALLLCVAAISAGPLACGNERSVHGDPDPATCSRCHGSADNAAPPLSVTGGRDASDPVVGAHQVHVRGGPLHAPIACSACHVVPQTVDAPGHIDNGREKVTFGAVAVMGGASPRWTRETATCSGTYCHGGTMGGGAHVAPVWNRGASEAACGACHGLPPPPPHVQNPDCGRCHLGYTASSVVAATHVDGKVDVKALECNTCHGSATSAAPPIGTAGETATTSLAVGAHQAHLRDGAVRARLGCTDCHVVPTAALHANGVAELTWGALATADGASPSFSPATATCAATYCHGATLSFGGGQLTAPVWTRVGEGQASCGACHAAPPPLPHPQRTDCGRCHPGTLTADGSAIDVAGGKHIDGHLDLAPLTCTMCHGTDGVNAAPPAGTHGETATSELAVGAHQQHVRDGSIRKAVGCAECHVEPTVPLHSNGAVDLAWGALAAKGTAPEWTRASGTCSSTYCHGATLALGGGTAKAPVWTAVSDGPTACNACHGAPPPLPHPQATDCARCHPGTVLATGGIDVAGGQHIDGIVQVEGRGSCTACHGRQGVNPAPPFGTRGETLTTQRPVGAHQKHVVDGAIRKAFACSDCHALVTDLGTEHANGTVSMPFTGLASRGTTPVWNGATCSSTYCHGATLGAGGNATVPTWTVVSTSPTPCGSCHGAPPSGNHPQSADCAACHPDTVNPDGTINVAGGRHIDGAIQVSGGCSLCHGSDANPAPPVGTKGETATTARAVGAHQAHVREGALFQAMTCEACHQFSDATHRNGTADLTWGTLASKNGAVPRFDATTLTCTNYCHGQTLAAGGKNTAPTWTKVDGTQAACGTCHGAPPSGNHPQSADCAACHPDTVNPDGTIKVAGGRHIDGAIQVSGGCSLCHGSDANPAPPVGTRGETATTARAVGAHQAHVREGALFQAMTCDACHQFSDATHRNGTADLTWGTLASKNGAVPRFDATTLTCTNYCHGQTLAADGKNTTPTWTKVDGTQAACGTCHGAPPAGNHPQSADCAACHPDTVNPDGTINVAGGRHIDGAVQVSGGCSLCHGSDANPAPPVGTKGETATTSRAVGAHQAHVREGALFQAMTCDACHQFSDATHRNGTADLTWGTLASKNGAVPRFDATTLTCTNYCHGQTLAAGGSLVTPTWTKVDGTQAACGTCHGSPPTTNHPDNPLCNSCHPLTVAIDGTIDVAGGRHIDGNVDVAGMTCSSCHGSTDNPAPPIGTHLETATTARAVGAHQAHVRDGTLRKALRCSDCHVVPTETIHSNGTVDLAWGPLATAGEAIAGFDPSALTCTNYCHGQTLAAGGKNTTPIWTRVDGTQAACGTCHGAPPPAPHPTSSPTGCAGCHPDTVKPDGSIDVEGGHHIDGKLDATGKCGACHGVPPANGAHLAHAAFPTPDVPQYGDLRILEAYAPGGASGYQFGCGNCHPLDAAKHMDLKVEVELTPAGAATGSLRARNAPDAVYDAATGRCSGVYCHSSGQALPAYATAPAWTSGAALGCDGCHGNPPSYASGGAGALDANAHIGLTEQGREFGHYVGLGGPAHASKHGSAVAGEAAAPVTCQTCHYATTDPTATGPSRFYWLDTTGSYVLAGGDPARLADPRWKATQCGTCHVAGGAPVARGKVLPLTHVNGRRDVVFDPRTALPPLAGLPAAPNTPTRPYWVSPSRFCEAVPAGAVLDGTTLSIELSGAAYDPATKRCSGVACHLGDAPVWGRQYLVSPASGTASCCRCHSTRCGP